MNKWFNSIHSFHIFESSLQSDDHEYIDALAWISNPYTIVRDSTWPVHQPTNDLTISINIHRHTNHTLIFILLNFVRQVCTLNKFIIKITGNAMENSDDAASFNP